MTFPTSGEIASFSRTLWLQDLAAKVVALRPTLQKRMSTPRPDVLRIGLPSRAHDPGPAVVVTTVRAGRQRCWLVVAPLRTTLSHMVWEASTGTETVAEAAVRMHDAASRGEQPGSPWLWAEPATTQVVRLADLLVERGFHVDAVADQNRAVPDAWEGYEQPRISGPGLGPALRILVDAGAATVAFKPTLGWVLDVDRDTGGVRRVDLTRGPDRRPSPQPGLRTDDVSTVAAAVSAALEDQPDLEDRTAGGSRPDSTAVSPHQAAAQWLRELGYPDARSSDDAMSVSTEAAHVVVRGPGRAVGLGDVKTAYADANVAGRSLFMFSCAGYTRPAREWADRAAAALFSLHPDGSAVHPASELAREHLPGML